MGFRDWLEKNFKDAEKSIALLKDIDKISAHELSGPASYNTIRYSPKGFYDTEELENLCSVEESNMLYGIGLDFSNPPDEFKNSLERIIEDIYSRGDDLNQVHPSKSRQLADIALDAGKLGKKIRGELGYVLMSDFSEEISQEDLEESLTIPNYFLESQESSQKTHEFYLFEGELRDTRHRKLSVITENEIALAWFVGRSLEEFDLGDDFKSSYNQRITDYANRHKSERS